MADSYKALSACGSRLYVRTGDRSRTAARQFLAYRPRLAKRMRPPDTTAVGEELLALDELLDDECARG
jgi:hypothetical protein